LPVTRITPMSEKTYTDAAEAVRDFASDIAAGQARDGAPKVSITGDRIVLRYSSGDSISYMGEFGSMGL
jgi:hypothetical protein